MIRNGHEFLEWLHRFREEETVRLAKLSDREYVELIRNEAEEIWRKLGCQLVPAPDGHGRIPVKIEET